MILALVADNPQSLTGCNSKRDARTSLRPNPLGAPERPRSELGTPAIRGFDWELPPAAIPGRGAAGGASWRLASRPRLVLMANDITSE
jgi:hypothetical protein